MRKLISFILIFYSVLCLSQISIGDTILATKTNSESSPTKSFLKQALLPIGLIGYGAFAQSNDKLKGFDKDIRSSVLTNYPGFKTKIDDGMVLTPAFSVYALNLFGVKGKNNFRDRTMILGLAMGLTGGIVLPIKEWSNVLRPDGSTPNSFPSGHTAFAFMSAEFMRMEYKDVSPWYGVGGYAVAIATGSLRIMNNRHWLSDVITGAGIGMLSTKMAYWVYPSIRKVLFKDKASSTIVMPYFIGGSGGLGLVYNFR
jgi:membrane-associated phospholipid phosphatase